MDDLPSFMEFAVPAFGAYALGLALGALGSPQRLRMPVYLAGALIGIAEPCVLALYHYKVLSLGESFQVGSALLYAGTFAAGFAVCREGREKHVAAKSQAQNAGQLRG